MTDFYKRRWPLWKIPFFLLFRDLKMLDSHITLIIVYLTFNLSFVIWLMRGFFNEVPQELEEAALVDGTTDLGAFIRIAFPLAAPGIVASTILSFIFSWNEFFYPNRIDLFFNNLINGYLRILCGLRALSNWPKFIPID